MHTSEQRSGCSDGWMVGPEQSAKEETNQAGTSSISISVPKNEGNIIGI